MSNLYFDVALKELKSNEFKTYMSIIYVIKSIGPNTKVYFSLKKDLYENVSQVHKLTEKTFLKHLKTFLNKGLLEFNGKAINLGFNIEDSKNGGYTSFNILDLEALLTELDSNEIKLYFTIYRLLKGFNKKSSKYSYSQLKTWSGIKNKAIFISTRNSLQEKKLISTLMDIENNSFVFKLVDLKISYNEKREEKKPHQVEKEQHNKSHEVEKKPYIKKYIPQNKNKYFKKSIPNQEDSKKFESYCFKEINEQKIFKFLDENIKTKHFSKKEKNLILEELYHDLKVNNGYKGVKIKSTADFYLAQEHPQYGRNIDKIIERLFYKKEQEHRDNKSRSMWINIFKKHYPEQIKGLDDYRENDISKLKLDKLVKKSPGVGYWDESFLYVEEKEVNPDFNKSVQNKANEYMDELIKKEVGSKEIGFDERLALIENFIPLIDEKYPPVNEFLTQKRKLKFEEFCRSYKDAR